MSLARGFIFHLSVTERALQIQRKEVFMAECREHHLACIHSDKAAVTPVPPMALSDPLQ